MGPVGSTAPVICPPIERNLLVLRILQLIINIGYVIAIAVTSADTGNWTYNSIEVAAALGATAAALTFANFFFYLTRFDPVLRPVLGSGKLKRILQLVARLTIDLSIAAIWGLAFGMSFHRKTVNFQKLFAPPPLKTWIPAVVLTLIETGLLLGSAFLVLAGYRLPPARDAANQSTDSGNIDPSISGETIELAEGGSFGATIVR
ncbi:MAG: hypothetical protein Q9166_005766 [cf. Caloplaca sp. 2 TL-2023]